MKNNYSQESGYNTPKVSCEYYIKHSVTVTYVTKDEWDSMSKDEQKRLVDSHKVK